MNVYVGVHKQEEWGHHPRALRRKFQFQFPIPDTRRTGQQVPFVLVDYITWAQTNWPILIKLWFMGDVFITSRTSLTKRRKEDEEEAIHSPPTWTGDVKVMSHFSRKCKCRKSIVIGQGESLAVRWRVMHRGSLNVRGHM